MFVLERVDGVSFWLGHEMHPVVAKQSPVSFKEKVQNWTKSDVSFDQTKRNAFL